MLQGAMPWQRSSTSAQPPRGILNVAVFAFSEDDLDATESLICIDGDQMKPAPSLIGDPQVALFVGDCMLPGPAQRDASRAPQDAKPCLPYETIFGATPRGSLRRLQASG